MSYKPKYEGFHTNRLHPEAGNEREIAFAEAWKKCEQWGRSGVLENLIGDGKYCHPLGEDQPSDRHAAKVAATVIQWLGSPVGFAFLVEVLSDCDYEVRRRA